MNIPMIYWFIPRGVFRFFDYLLLGLFLLWLGWLVWNLFKPNPRERFAAIVLLLATFGLVAWWAKGNYEERLAWEKRQAYSKSAWAHFRKRCQSAHITYYKSVPVQDGVFIMKPGTKAYSRQLKDQFWMGDPYDLPDDPESEARGLLYRKKTMPAGNPWGERGGFDFVEAPHPTLTDKYVRYSVKWSVNGTKWGEPIPDFDRTRSSPDTVSTRLSRYGYTWDDISTKEDRHYWVAGGRMRVVDLETGEVVAERVGYVIERYFGATGPTFNQTPWSNTRGHKGTTCPELRTRRILLSNALGTWDELQPDGGNK